MGRRSPTLAVLGVALLVASGGGHSAQAQGFLERLEQRVRDGLRTAADPAEQAATTQPDPAATDPATPAVPPSLNAPPAATPPGAAPPPSLRPPVSAQEPVMLGLELEELLVPGGGLTVTAVMPRTPAEAAGFRRGDVLLTFGQRPVNRLQDVVAALERQRPGDRVTMRLRRDGQVIETTALLAPAPAARASAESPANPAGSSVDRAAAASPVPRGPLQAARLGIEVDDMVAGNIESKVQRGAIVIAVQPNSPAAAAGIRVGDIIVAVDGKVVTGVRTMLTAMSAMRPGQPAEVTYYSGNDLHRKTLIAAGADGLLPPAALAEMQKLNEGQPRASDEGTAEGIGGWLGGFGKMFGGAKPEVASPGALPQESVPNALPEPAADAPRDAAVLAAENAELKAALKQLEDRIAELERRLDERP